MDKMVAMCVWIIKFFLISLYFNVNHASICQPTVDYINGKLRNSKVEIAKAYIQDPESVTAVTYDIKPKVLWTREFDSRALTIGRTIDEMFVLVENNRVMSLGIDVNPPDSPSTVGFYELSTFTAEIPMKFIKSLIWEKSMYLLICYEENFCTIYTSTGDSELQYQHTTRHPGKPIDANFFVVDNQLYLVIATNLGSLPSDSVIYRWTGTYMDEINKIDLKSVISVVTFDHRGTTILVFSQNDGISNVGSKIYKLIIDEKSGQGSTEFIQFLEINRPVGMHLYNDKGCTFLLILNEAEASQVFWWDGKGFLPWIKVDIQGQSLLNSVQMNKDTFLFVAQVNFLSIYKITSMRYELLDKFEIPDILRIIDMGVWSDGQIISVVLISERAPNLYRVEPWQFFMNKVKKGKALRPAQDESESTIRCMKKLLAKLHERMKDVEKLRGTWEKLYSASENLVIDELNADVILRSPGSSLDLENLEIASDNSEEIIPPKELKSLVHKLRSEIDKSLNKSRHLMTINDKTKKLVLPSLTITNSAHFQSLETPILITGLINSADPTEKLKNSISATKNQTFNETLHGINVVIHNLEVDSMCGVPKKFWLFRNETSRIPLKPITGRSDVEVQIKIDNDTVSMTSDIFIPKLEAEVINSVNLSAFLNNLFIPGKNQVIDGDVTFRDLSIEELAVNNLNGVPRESLITIDTDQHFEHSVYVDALNVQHLEVNRINGISINEAAKVAEENVIKGKVVMNHLRITEELIVDENCSLFEQAHQIQVYDDVTIIGNVTIRQLQLENQTSVDLQDEKTKGNDVDHLFSTSWTKSGDQKIVAPIVTFGRGLTIDELNAEYLNGVAKDDYLYTTAETIPPKFGGLHFADLTVKGTVLRENRTSLVEIAEDSMIFNERVVFKKLAAVNFFSESYNGVPIHRIMNNSRNSNETIEVSLPDDLKFDKITVNNKLHVTNLHFKTLNHREYSNILFVDDNHKVENVKSEKFRAANYRSSAGISRRAAELIPSEQMDIVIDGPLIVDGNLNVDELINQQSVENYLKQLSTSDIRVNDPGIALDELIVLQDATINRLYGEDFNEFINNIFSKTKDQVLTGRMNFHRVTAENVDAETINGKRIDQMHLINDSLTFVGDLIFKNLSADIDTAKLNGASSTWINGDLSSISSRNISQMTLTGHAIWRNDSSPKTLSKIIRNAVRSNTDDVIEKPVDFTNLEETAQIASISTKHSSFSLISDIVKDAVVNNKHSIAEISGKKRFLKDVEVKELYVDNVAIDKLEKTTIGELNASIVRKFEDNTVIPGTCVFTADGTRIAHLNISDLGPGMPNISSLFVLSDEEDNYLPNGTYFKHLVINDNVFLQSLDGVNFDDFLRQRVTLTGNHTVNSNVRFNGHIQVTGNVEADEVNGVIPSEIVLKDASEPQVIGGEKVFLTDLIVEKDAEAPLFNGINILQEYNQGILNNESPVINGDLIIEGSIELQQDPVVLGKVNGFRLDTYVKDVEKQRNQCIEMIGRNMTIINDHITDGVAVLNGTRLPQLFHHFEVEENLKIPQIQNITSVVPLIFAETTKLNVYGTESGEDCPGLPNDCTCRSQYVITISRNSSEFKKEDSSWTVFNFHQPNDEFVINVATNTVSSSPECSRDDGVDEYIAISWMTKEGSKSADQFTHYPEKIGGYLSDVKVFVHAGDAYVVLALAYDVQKRTHRVDSLIFRLDLKSNALNHVLKIPMISASAVEVFRVHEKGSHVLIASDAPEDPENSAKSLLFRIKPRTKEFELLRSFYSGGTRRIKSLAYRDQDFVILDDVKMNSVHIYNYESSFDNFYLYQSLYFDGKINSVETFYAGEFRWSDAFVIITIDNDRFFVYQYTMFGKFQEVMSKWVHGVIAVTPFYLPEAQYLFVTARNSSSVYRIVGQGH